MKLNPFSKKTTTGYYERIKTEFAEVKQRVAEAQAAADEAKADAEAKRKHAFELEQRGNQHSVSEQERHARLASSAAQNRAGDLERKLSPLKTKTQRNSPHHRSAGQLDRRTHSHHELRRRRNSLQTDRAQHANLIAKLAAGLADDFLSTFYLAVKAPVLIAPAMNQAMFEHPQTQANIKKLKETRSRICGTRERLFSLWPDRQRPAGFTPKNVETSLRLIRRQPVFKDQLVVITAGPTREALDPVRFLSNRSSGRMGYELAREAYQLGAEVVLISGPVELEPPAGVKVEQVVSSEEMRQVILKYI